MKEALDYRRFFGFTHDMWPPPLTRGLKAAATGKVSWEGPLKSEGIKKCYAMGLSQADRIIKKYSVKLHT